MMRSMEYKVYDTYSNAAGLTIMPVSGDIASWSIGKRFPAWSVARWKSKAQSIREIARNKLLSATWNPGQTLRPPPKVK